MTHDIRIDLETPTSGRVFIDGIEVKGVTRFELVGKAGGVVHELTLTIIPSTVKVTGLAEVIERHAKLG